MNASVLSVLLLVLVGKCLAFWSPRFQSRIRMPELIAHGGHYRTEQHDAFTGDGYVLQLQRMVPRRAAATGDVVLFVHGIMGCAEDFVRKGNESIAFMVAKAGYDVWLGNLRGTSYSSHIQKRRSDASYWDFSVDEHGREDVPAMVEFVLWKTGKQQLHFVGFSMATTSYFIMCNHRPDLAAKITSFIAMAPVAFMGERIKAVARLAQKFDIVHSLQTLGPNPLGLNPFVQSVLASIFCGGKIRGDFCSNVVFPYMGEDPDQVDGSQAALVLGSSQPFSIQQIIFYGQLALTDQLSRFDWGPEINMKKYGQALPPNYTLTANVAPTALFYGKNDPIASPAVVEKTAAAMRNSSPVIIMKPVAHGKFNHLDFVFAKDIAKLVNEDVLGLLNTFSQKSNEKRTIRGAYK